MNRHGAPAGQRGMALIMSLTFLLLLALAAAALLETTGSQSRLSVAQQQSHEQFLNLQCALLMVSHQRDEIYEQASKMDPDDDPQPWDDTRNTTKSKCGLPNGASIELKRLRDCEMPGSSSEKSICWALEVRGEVEHGTTHAKSKQVQGLVFKAINVSSDNAGMF